MKQTVINDMRFCYEGKLFSYCHRLLSWHRVLFYCSVEIKSLGIFFFGFNEHVIKKTHEILYIKAQQVNKLIRNNIWSNINVMNPRSFQNKMWVNDILPNLFSITFSSFTRLKSIEIPSIYLIIHSKKGNI